MQKKNFRRTKYAYVITFKCVYTRLDFFCGKISRESPGDSTGRRKFLRNERISIFTYFQNSKFILFRQVCLLIYIIHIVYFVTCFNIFSCILSPEKLLDLSKISNVTSTISRSKRNRPEILDFELFSNRDVTLSKFA